MARGCSLSSEPSSAPVRRRFASRVNTPNSTAVSRTLDAQNENAACRMADGLGCDDDIARLWRVEKYDASHHAAISLHGFRCGAAGLPCTLVPAWGATLG